VERGDARGALDDLQHADMMSVEARACRGRALALLARHDEALSDLEWVVAQGRFDAEVLGLAERTRMPTSLRKKALNNSLLTSTLWSCGPRPRQ